MTRLGVNIDHIATIREARRAREPDPIAAAVIAELAGADGITVHLRGDRRHIKERDLELLRQVVTTKLNVEMAATAEMVKLALATRPDQVTLVPERLQEVTTEGGLDVALNSTVVRDAVRQLREGGIHVSLFIDANPDQVREARKVGAEAIEINTGPYADARGPRQQEELDKVIQSARMARKLDLTVLAGHGLTYANVRRISEIAEIEELNIGHNIVARAALVGLERAVREMVAAMAGVRA